MTYSFDLKIRAAESYLNKYTNRKQILKIFKISAGVLYKWISLYKKGLLVNKQTKRKSKITLEMKEYIRNYKKNRTNFDYRKLIKIVEKKFNISISKSSLYEVLKR